MSVINKIINNIVNQKSKVAALNEFVDLFPFFSSEVNFNKEKNKLFNSLEWKNVNKEDLHKKIKMICIDQIDNFSNDEPEEKPKFIVEIAVVGWNRYLIGSSAKNEKDAESKIKKHQKNIICKENNAFYHALDGISDLFIDENNQYVTRVDYVGKI